MSPRNTISGCGMVGIYQPSFFFLRRYSARNARSAARLILPEDPANAQLSRVERRVLRPADPGRAHGLQHLHEGPEDRAGADEQAAAIECILSGAHGTASSAAGGLRHAMVNSGSFVFSSRPSDSITNPSRW